MPKNINIENIAASAWLMAVAGGNYLPCPLAPAAFKHNNPIFYRCVHTVATIIIKSGKKQKEWKESKDHHCLSS